MSKDDDLCERLQKKVAELQEVLRGATGDTDHPVLVVIPGTKDGVDGTHLIGETPDDWRARDSLGALEAAKAKPLKHIQEVLDSQS